MLEQEIIPLFYERDNRGIPVRWVGMMRASLVQLASFFSSNRMLREYLEVIYTPAIRRYQARTRQPRELSRALALWERNLREHWHEIHLGQGTATGDGSKISVELPVVLGDVDPGGVRVEIYADPAGDMPLICEPLERARPIPGTTNGYIYEGVLEGPRPLSHLTPRVVPAHAEALIPLELGLIQWAPDALVSRDASLAANDL